MLQRTAGTWFASTNRCGRPPLNTALALMRDVLRLVALLVLLGARGVDATTFGAAPICRPVMVPGKCYEATAYYSVRSAESGATANVSLIKLHPDGPLRPWAECVAAKWRSFEPFNQPSVAGTRTVEYRFESIGCDRPAE